MLLCTISIEDNLVYQGGLRVLYTNFSMFFFVFVFSFVLATYNIENRVLKHDNQSNRDKLY